MVVVVVVVGMGAQPHSQVVGMWLGEGVGFKEAPPTAGWVNFNEAFAISFWVLGQWYAHTYGAAYTSEHGWWWAGVFQMQWTCTGMLWFVLVYN